MANTIVVCNIFTDDKAIGERVSRQLRWVGKDGAQMVVHTHKRDLIGKEPVTIQIVAPVM